MSDAKNSKTPESQVDANKVDQERVRSGQSAGRDAQPASAPPDEKKVEQDPSEQPT